VALRPHVLLNRKSFWRALCYAFVRALAPDPLVRMRAAEWAFDPTELLSVMCDTLVPLAYTISAAASTLSAVSSAAYQRRAIAVAAAGAREEAGRWAVRAPGGGWGRDTGGGHRWEENTGGGHQDEDDTGGGQQWGDTGGGHQWSGDTGGGHQWSGDTGGGQQWSGDTGGGHQWSGDTGGGHQWEDNIGGGHHWSGDIGGGHQRSGDTGGGHQWGDTCGESPRVNPPSPSRYNGEGGPPSTSKYNGEGSPSKYYGKGPLSPFRARPLQQNCSSAASLGLASPSKLAQFGQSQNSYSPRTTADPYAAPIPEWPHSLSHGPPLPRQAWAVESDDYVLGPGHDHAPTANQVAALRVYDYQVRIGEILNLPIPYLHTGPRLRSRADGRSGCGSTRLRLPGKYVMKDGLCVSNFYVLI